MATTSTAELDAQAQLQEKTERQPSQDSAESGNAYDKETDVGPAPEGGTRAWLVAGAGASLFFCTLGLANSFGVFEDYYLTHQLVGQSASKVSWIGSMHSFLQFFAGMVGGPLFDRYGGKV
jgi:hypothetical protein